MNGMSVVEKGSGVNNAISFHDSKGIDADICCKQSSVLAR